MIPQTSYTKLHRNSQLGAIAQDSMQKLCKFSHQCHNYHGQGFCKDLIMVEGECVCVCEWG